MKRENNLNVNTALAKIKSFLKHFKAVKMRSGKNFYHINANSFLLRFIIKITNYSRRKYFWCPKNAKLFLGLYQIVHLSSPFIYRSSNFSIANCRSLSHCFFGFVDWFMASILCDSNSCRSLKATAKSHWKSDIFRESNEEKKHRTAKKIKSDKQKY